MKCPRCLNLNRAARRACRACGRTGWVAKRVPTVEAQAAHLVERELRSAIEEQS